jgi:all-trans-retinol 13,14-reductase
VGSLLAKAGRRVAVLEAHDQPGGYAHTFQVRDYRFCAQVHYVFSCGEGEGIHDLLCKLGVEREVPFVRLDPEGFDHVVVDGDRLRIPKRLRQAPRSAAERSFPTPSAPLRSYFEILGTIASELALLDMPRELTPGGAASSVAGAAYRARHLLYYRRWTLEDLYDHVAMPPLGRARSSPGSVATTSCRRATSRCSCTWPSSRSTTAAPTTRRSTTSSSSRRSRRP